MVYYLVHLVFLLALTDPELLKSVYLQCFYFCNTDFLGGTSIYVQCTVLYVLHFPCYGKMSISLRRVLSNYMTTVNVETTAAYSGGPYLLDS